jgi:L-ascorbate metabolism protein UlaG (beta-lactamase superfamily)
MDLHITHYDTAMVRLDIGPFRLLTDPVLDPPGRVYAFPGYRLEKLGGTRDRDALAAAIGPVDAILLSHAQHRDNLDEAGRALLYATPKTVTTVPSAWSLSRRRPAGSSAEMVGLQEWESHTLTAPGGEQLRITAVPAQHAPSWMFPERLRAIGKVTGFVLEWDGQRDGGLYVSGDTVAFSGLRAIAKRFPRIGLGLFHLGSARFPVLGPVRLSLGAKAALKVDDWLKPRNIVPIHYDGWKHFSQTPDEVREVFREAGRAHKLHWLTPGRTHTIHHLRSP